MVERMLCTHEVIGSNPIISNSEFWIFYFLLSKMDFNLFYMAVDLQWLVIIYLLNSILFFI